MAGKVKRKKIVFLIEIELSGFACVGSLLFPNNFRKITNENISRINFTSLGPSKDQR